MTDRVHSQTSHETLAGAVVAGRLDRATTAAAEEIAAGASSIEVARTLVGVALSLSGGDLRGATWSHAVLSTLAAAELAGRMPDAVVAPAVVGLAGFVAFARPSRAAAGGAHPALAAADLSRLAFDAPGGWGHGVLVAGHALRAPWPDLAPALIAAAGRYLVPAESGPGVVGDAVVVLPGDDLDPARAVGLAEAIVAAGEAPLQVRGTRSEIAAGAGLAALELLRQAPNMRGIHHLTVLRETLAAPVDEGRALVLGCRFIADGWERARRDRRAREAPAFSITPGPGVDRDAIAELLAVEPRPGMGHNIKLASAALALEELLPVGLRPSLRLAVAATLPTWTRSRRPWLVLQAARRAL